MPRFKAILEYNGQPFYGWQTQKEGTGVQDAVESSFFQLFQKPVKTFCSGRTDRGVHAMAQVIHCDIDTDMDGNKLREAMNYHLKPHPISILKANIVDHDFHARFHAKMRYYTYKILNRRAPETYRRGLVWHIPISLDLDKMRTSMQDFIGTHDFTTFRSTECQSPSPIRTIEALCLETIGDEIHFHVTAKSFLHHQIRSMIGSLVKIGLGKYPADFIKKALLKKERAFCGPVAPAAGLYFKKTDY